MFAERVESTDQHYVYDIYAHDWRLSGAYMWRKSVYLVIYFDFSRPYLSNGRAIGIICPKLLFLT